MPASKKLGFLSLGVLLPIVVISIALAGFLHFSPVCGEEIIRELPSPDRRYSAASLERNCGATTPYVEHVNVRRANRKFSRELFNGTITEGEVFTFEQRTRNDSPVFLWSGTNTLQIGNSCDQRTSKLLAWSDVKIEYLDSTCKR